MSPEPSSAARVTEIAVLLRPERTRKLAESLTAAAMSGDLDAMQLFLDRGANIEERSMFISPLGAACSAGQLAAVRWLVERGAVLDPPGAMISPIQSALGKVQCEIAAVLLDAGLPIDKAAWGVIAAASLGKVDMARWLIGRGVELDRAYPRLGVLRQAAIAAAEKEGHAESARFLRGELGTELAPTEPPPSQDLRRSHPPQASPTERDTLRDEAVGLIHAAGKAAARWKATGASASKRGLLICHAAGHGVTEIVTALLDAGVQPDAADDGTAPALTRAAEEAHGDIVRLLLERGASPNGRDGKSWLPLVGAVMSGEPEMVKLLLDAGANPKAKPAGARALGDYLRGPYTTEIRALLETAPTPKGAARTKRGRV